MKFISFLITLFFICCETAKKNYSYKIVTYGEESGVKHELPFLEHLISYEGYLFEFNVGVRTIDSINILTKETFSQYRYDTLGVYLLNPNNRQFYEFSDFSLSGKLKSHGKFSDKKFGIKLSDSIPSSKLLIDNKFKDTVLLENRKAIYVEKVEQNLGQKDSVRTRIFFIKDPRFTSLYELQFGKSSNTDYSMVAFSTLLYENNYHVIGNLEQLRPLNREEEKICNRMTKLMKEVMSLKTEYSF